MAELTKQDIDLISTAIHSWANQPPTMLEIEKIATGVIGGKLCPCTACQVARGGKSVDELIVSHREKIEEAVAQSINQRRERAAVLTAKLVAMRDSMVADQFFASIGENKI